jgi:hypothetical protein
MMHAPPQQANGHARPVTLIPLRLPVHGSVQSWPAQDDPAQPRTPADEPGHRWQWHAPDGDTVIRVLAAVVVLAVAAFAAIVSYSHIFELGVLHHQIGTAARLLPLSVDGLIASASLVMLHAARRELRVPPLARAMLALGVGATVAANVGYGLPFGWLSAVISAWPAVAFVGSVEMAIRLAHAARQGDSGQAAAAPGDDEGGTGDSGGGSPPPPPPPAWQSMPPGGDKAAAIMTARPGLTNAEVAQLAGCDRRTVQRARNGLAPKGAP